MSPSEIYEKNAKSTVFIQSFKDGAKGNYGSGVILPGGNLVATNCHVVENEDPFEVHSNKKSYHALKYLSDIKRDVCLLEVIDFNEPAVTLGHTATLKPGNYVYAIGSPQGLKLTISNGIVSNLIPDDSGYNIIQTNAAISPGSSGGGLFDENGELVGLVTRYQNEGQNLNFAVPVEWVEELLARSISSLQTEVKPTQAEKMPMAEKLKTEAEKKAGEEKIKAEQRERLEKLRAELKEREEILKAEEREREERIRAEQKIQEEKIEAEQRERFEKIRLMVEIKEREEELQAEQRENVEQRKRKERVRVEQRKQFKNLRTEFKAQAQQKAKQRERFEKLRAEFKEREEKLKAEQRAREERIRAEQRAMAEEAAANSKIVGEYKARIIAKIHRNIVMPPGIPYNAVAEFEVTLLPGGMVLNTQLMKPSGIAVYDLAVERAIKKSQPLPLPPDPALFNRFRELNLKVSPKE